HDAGPVQVEVRKRRHSCRCELFAQARMPPWPVIGPTGRLKAAGFVPFEPSMLRFTGRPTHFCSGPARREFLRVGGLTLGSLGLPALLNAKASPKAKAKSCLLIFMDGGPSNLEMWDLKPNAPAEVRGEFQPIKSSVPGLTVGELLPL